MFPQWGQMPVQKTDDQFSYPPLMANGQPWPKLEFGAGKDPRGEDITLLTNDRSIRIGVTAAFDRNEMIAKRPSHIVHFSMQDVEYAARELFPEEKVENAKAFLITQIKKRYEAHERTAVRFDAI